MAKIGIMQHLSNTLIRWLPSTRVHCEDTAAKQASTSLDTARISRGDGLIDVTGIEAWRRNDDLIAARLACSSHGEDGTTYDLSSDALGAESIDEAAWLAGQDVQVDVVDALSDKKRQTPRLCNGRCPDLPRGEKRRRSLPRSNRSSKRRCANAVHRREHTHSKSTRFISVTQRHNTRPLKITAEQTWASISTRFASDSDDAAAKKNGLRDSSNLPRSNDSKYEYLYGSRKESASSTLSAIETPASTRGCANRVRLGWNATRVEAAIDAHAAFVDCSTSCASEPSHQLLSLQEILISLRTSWATAGQRQLPSAPRRQGTQVNSFSSIIAQDAEEGEVV